LKKLFTGIILTLLLTSMLTMAFNIQPAKSDYVWTETIYIRADGSVEPLGAPVSTVDNVTYTLTDNIAGDVPDSSSAIIIERNNTVLDGASYTLEGTEAYPSIGIELAGRSNVTIKNVKITAFYCGVWLGSSSGNTISGNNITNNEYGIQLSESSNNSISENNITANNFCGIRLYYSSNYNSISGNNITNIGYGIWLDFSSNNSVSGNNITNNYCGIYLDYSSNYNSVSGNNITNNYCGISLSSSSNNSISENNITANNSGGIELYSSNYNSVSGNNITNNYCGISLSESSNNSISGNNITANNGNFGVYGNALSHFVNYVDVSNLVDGKPVYYWINRSYEIVPPDAGYVALVNCTGITVQNLNLTNNAQGILIAYTQNSTITNNNITNNWTGIRLDFSSNNSVSGNNITNNWTGIRLDFSSNNSISENNITANNYDGIGLGYSSNYNSVSGNNITNNYYGIVLGSSSNNSISGNNITNNYYGIVLGSSSNNSVSGNNITNNSGGIRLDYSSNNSISGNNITNNLGGIGLYYSSNNSISGNNITNNYYGIELYSSSNNSIYHNNFIDNAEQAHSHDSTNVWDDGYPSGGNYWSNYTGVDLCSGPYQNETGSDGIGDVPYVIDANNTDYYPLMNPWPSGWKLDFTAPTNHPIVDFAVYKGSLYAAADNKLYVYNGSWNALNAPTFVTSLEPYEDKLIVGGQGGLHYYDGTSFGLIFSVPTYIKALGVYDNRLYAGTMLDKPPTLYYCNGSCENPSNWYVDTDFTAMLNFSGPFGSIDSFAVYDNVMYVGSGGTLYSFNGTSWSIAASYADVYAFLDMQVYNGKLYFAMRDQAWRKPVYQGGTGFSGRIIQYDGSSWTTVFDHDYWMYSLEVYDGKLYAGTANKILTYNGTSWEVSFATEGAYYALCFENYDDKIYAGMGNGHIFADPAETASPQTPTVPEFPSFIILLLFMIATLLAVIVYRRKTVSDRTG